MQKPTNKKLLKPLKKNAGRNSQGRITVRHRGGGSRRKYRVIDFGQKLLGQKIEVVAIEYDPNRTCNIALVKNEKNEQTYFLAADGVKIGDQLVIDDKAPLKPGNRMRIKNVPVGTMVYNIELTPDRGGKIARAAGNSAQVMSHEGKHANLKMPSSEIRKVLINCFVSIGQLSNPEHRFEKIGKAGRNRLKGKRPQVRGLAMNPVDHPHGGGEGRSSIGMKHPKTKWGKIAMGVKTRKKKKYSDRLIIQRRKKKKR